MTNFLSLIEGSYLFIAIFGGTIFLLLFAMTMIGLGHDADGSGFDVDAHDIHDIQGVSFLSVKSVVAFFTFYGLGGLCFKDYGWGGFGLAIGCGAVMMVVVSLLLALIVRLQHSGNVVPEEVVGRSGVVYLSVPANRTPGGLATISLDSGTIEVSAVADEALPTGTAVVVAQTLGNNTYVVRKKF